jgi:hypothetical protein
MILVADASALIAASPVYMGASLIQIVLELAGESEQSE